MTLRSTAIAVMLALGALVGGARAMAQPMGPPPPGHDGPKVDGLRPLMMLLKNASLTQAQQDQVHLLMESHRAKVDPLLQKLHADLDQIADKLMGSADVVTLQDLTPLQSQAAQVQQQIDQANLETAIQIRGLLTPAQRTHLADVHRQISSLRAQLDSLMHPAGSPMQPQ